MVDFRYHLVSIVAVFLALGVGMLIGTAALNGAVLNDLEDRVNTLQSDNDALKADVDQANNNVAAGDVFAGESSPFVLPGRLDGQSVVLITTPGADQDDVDKVLGTLRAAGAAVTGQVAITDKLTDPAVAKDLAKVVPTLAPAGTTLPTTDDPYELTGALLGDVLVRDTGAATLPPAEIQEAIGGLEGVGVIDADDIGTQATLALTVVGPASKDQEADKEFSEAVTPVLVGVGAGAAGALVSGPTSSTDHDAVLATIRNTKARDTLSTLDNVQYTVGQTSVPAALLTDLKGTVAQYGTGQGAQTPVPPLS